MDLPAAPVGLWARIQRGVEQGGQASPAAPRRETAIPVVVTRDDAAPSLAAPKGQKSWERRAALGIGAILLVTSAVLVADSWRPLAAATPRRLTLDKEYVVPGGTITAHYRPISRLAGSTTVTVWADYDQGSVATRWYLRPLVRAGVLRRVSALDYAGVIRLPDSARVARYIIGDSLGRILDRPTAREPRYPATVLAADTLGRPRFDALVALLGKSRDVGDWRPSSDQSLLVRSANAMTRYYPSRPETWILTYPIAHRSVISDIVKRFESRERVYYGWYDALEHRTGLSAETELMMAGLGWELMDTARADFWIGRLLEEHPTHPAGAELWLGRYRDVPDDSAATILRAFEPIFAAVATPTPQAIDRALKLAERSGDEELIRRWRLRGHEDGDDWAVASERGSWPRDSASLVTLERRLLVQLAEEDRDSLGTPTIWATAQLDAYLNWQRRLRIRTSLAAIQLMRGQLSASRARLDSLVHEFDARPACPAPETMRWRAEAEQRLGEMTKARDDYAYVASTGDWRSRAAADSGAASLGVVDSPESWRLAKQLASERLRNCFLAFRDHRRAEGW